MNRRAFFAALVAPFVARFFPSKALTAGEAYFNRNCYLPSRKIGETFHVKIPVRFVGSLGAARGLVETTIRTGFSLVGRSGDHRGPHQPGAPDSTPLTRITD